jgi:hypothetical protein
MDGSGSARDDDPMRRDMAALPAERISEVALWCSLHGVTGVHLDTPDEARRRRLMKEANSLLASAKYPCDSWLRRSLPSGRRWTRAMNLMREADPDSLAPLEHQLRSSTLKPADSIGSGSYSEELRQETVDGVIAHRIALLKSRPPSEDTIPANQLRGKILLYVPCENVSDGASKYASNGFFDAYDCPPWDMWLYYCDRTLMSWVPEILLPLAQAGIDANPVECIKWAD